MSAQWRRALVLGGIRSGKSEYAEALVAGLGTVRYVATARRGDGDVEWLARIDAHRTRRPAHWRTDEVGDDPFALLDLLNAAAESDTLLVDDLGTWVAALSEVVPPGERGLDAYAERLAAAVAGCPAQLVLVSPEVGLALVPATESGRLFADALGDTNRAVAAVSDRVVLVIAGCAVPVKGGL
jgi:adenosyl cobinamide kinase/adenosyl cobinamide phosphate guanylyltransferase